MEASDKLLVEVHTLWNVRAVEAQHCHEFSLLELYGCEDQSDHARDHFQVYDKGREG